MEILNCARAVESNLISTVDDCECIYRSWHGAGEVTGVSNADVDSKSLPPYPHEYFEAAVNPCFVDEKIDSRSINAENPTGGRSAGGVSHGGRKGNSGRILSPGEKVVLADIKGPGTLRHIWMALDWGRPESMRALRLEGFYDGMSEPSISAPVADFFGLPHGRATEFYSQLITVPEGRGINSYIPMPFGRSVRIELTNEADKAIGLAYQIDYTLEPLLPERTHYLHASFRRENPTALRRDFVITEGLKGPGRFLGCVVGIRVLDKSTFYGEGEMKIYRDGDQEFPTVCGTGLEDYVGSAYGLSRHYGQYAGAPLMLFAPDADKHPLASPDYLSFYRWHIPDPIMFSRDLRVTLQQIGWIPRFKSEEELERYKATHLPASGKDWILSQDGKRLMGIAERQDDYCATAFVYCRTPQPVPRLDIDSAIANVARMPYEKLTPFEEMILRMTNERPSPRGEAGISRPSAAR